jgi:hypothetical protein
MDISLETVPVGDTTSRELSKAAQDLRAALEGLEGVTQINIAQQPTPERGKGVGEVVGKFFVSMAPAAVSVVMQALKTVLAPHPQTKVVIETKGGKFKFEFDPKTVSLKELVAAADQLRAVAPRP